jgi:hypothetical protein
MSTVIDMVNNNDQSMQTRLAIQKNYTDTFYNWDKRAKEWEGLIRGILRAQKA